MKIDWTTAIQLKDLIGPVVALLAVGGGLWQYRRTSKREFIKPLREAQLQLYQAATSAAAKLATLPRDSEEWSKNHTEFLRLYYGPLAIFEDFDHRPGAKTLTVERAMVVFKTCLDDTTQDEQLQDLSLALAHTCRESLGRSWGVELPQLHGTYQKLAMDYWERIQKTSQTGADN